MNIVDSLVVELGLNSKDFIDGVKGSTDALEGFATKALGVFGLSLGFEAMVGYFKDIHQQLAGVGFESRNLGVASTELMRYGEVARLMGGQASDAISAVQGLQGAIFNLQYRGQMSDQLAMMQRFGVAYLTASGHMRDIKDIAHDAAGAIDFQAKATGMDQGQRYQMALSMGFTGGIASAVSQGGKGLETAIAESAEDQKRLTDRMVQGQVKLSQGLTRLDAATTANSAAILNQLTPQIEAAVKELTSLAQTELPKIVTAISDVQNFFKSPPPWFKTLETDFQDVEKTLGPVGTLATMLGAGGVLVGALNGLAKTLLSTPLSFGKGAATVAGGAAERSAFTATLGEWVMSAALGIGLGELIDKIPTGDDKNLGDRFDDFWGKVFSLIEVGDRGALKMNDLFAKAGMPLLGPNLVPAIPSPSVPLYLSAPPPTPNAMRFTPYTAPGPNGAPGSKPTASNIVTFENITVNTKATDAYRMASDLHDALGKKFLVASADRGLA